MSAIDLTRPHNLPLAEAKTKVQHVADQIAAKFDVDCAWDGDMLNFSRSGVDGHITVDAKSVHVFAELGFMLSMMKVPIEDAIGRYLDDEFS